MEEIILTEAVEPMNSDAGNLLLEYLRRENRTLSREEWQTVLEQLRIPESRDLTAGAEALGILLPEGEAPDREPFVLEPMMCIYLTARSLELNLTPREWEVLRYRNGFADGTIHTRRETGEKFGVSGERIQQVEAKVFRRIACRDLKRRKDLAQFYK